MEGSIKERMAVMPRIQISHDEEFVMEVKFKGKVVAELIVSVNDIEYNFTSGTTRIRTSVYNPSARDSTIHEFDSND